MRRFNSHSGNYSNITPIEAEHVDIILVQVKTSSSGWILQKNKEGKLKGIYAERLPELTLVFQTDINSLQQLEMLLISCSERQYEDIVNSPESLESVRSFCQVAKRVMENLLERNGVLERDLAYLNDFSQKLISVPFRFVLPRKSEEQDLIPTPQIRTEVPDIQASNFFLARMANQLRDLILLRKGSPF